jgi:transglutaminase-like putative cysteine protease
MSVSGMSVSLQCELASPGDVTLLVLPAITNQQRIGGECLSMSHGARARVTTGPYGQRLLHVKAHGRGTLKIDYSARVDIEHHLTPAASLGEADHRDLPCDVRPYVKESVLCPVDPLIRLARSTIGAMPPGYARVATLCACLRERTRFDPDQSGVRKSVLDTLIDRSGASEHFAHLAIALCRALLIPARLVSVTGQDVPPAAQGSGLHHCIEVFMEGRWYLLDPTGRSSPMGLIRIGTGRDGLDIPAVGGSELHGRSDCRFRITAMHGTLGRTAYPDEPAQAVSTARGGETDYTVDTDDEGRYLARAPALLQGHWKPLTAA